MAFLGALDVSVLPREGEVISYIRKIRALVSVSKVQAEGRRNCRPSRLSLEQPLSFELAGVAAAGSGLFAVQLQADGAAIDLLEGQANTNDVAVLGQLL